MSGWVKDQVAGHKQVSRLLASRHVRVKMTFSTGISGNESGVLQAGGYLHVCHAWAEAPTVWSVFRVFSILWDYYFSYPVIIITWIVEVNTVCWHECEIIIYQKRKDLEQFFPGFNPVLCPETSHEKVGVTKLNVVLQDWICLVKSICCDVEIFWWTKAHFIGLIDVKCHMCNFSFTSNC